MSVEKKWRGRAFVSLNMVLSFLVLIVSSVVLYVMPPGRDAYWSNWTLAGLGKDQWDAIHTVGGAAFLIFGILHLFVYNWKPFWNYVVSRVRRTLNRKAETTAAVLLNIFLVVVCVVGWFPSSTIMGWMSSIKESWITSVRKAPFPHAELETLEVVAGRSGIDLEAALPALRAAGLTINPARTVKAIADENAMTPIEFFEKIAPFGKNAADSSARGAGSGQSGLQEGGGWGKKTVESTAKEYGIDIETALKKLQAKGIAAKKNDSLRELSGKSGLTPTAIAAIIRD